MLSWQARRSAVRPGRLLPGSQAQSGRKAGRNRRNDAVRPGTGYRTAAAPTGGRCERGAAASGSPIPELYPKSGNPCEKQSGKQPVSRIRLNQKTTPNRILPIHGKPGIISQTPICDWDHGVICRKRAAGLASAQPLRQRLLTVRSIGQTFRVSSMSGQNLSQLSRNLQLEVLGNRQCRKRIDFDPVVTWQGRKLEMMRNNQHGNCQLQVHPRLSRTGVGI